MRLHRVGVEGALEQAATLGSWLLDNPSESYPGMCWGYPFDWYSRVFIPQGTPSAVVTSTCGQALLDLAELTDDDQAEEGARGAALFLAEGLNRTEFPDGSLCLSYTPLDDFQVHNASLMAAEFLLRCGARYDRQDWRDIAVRCLAFTVGDQRDDGSFEYWGPDQVSGSHVDNYHTGFVLRSLHAFAAAGVQEADDALAAGWSFYRDHLLGSDGRPSDLVGRSVPLNIHSCAESILCPSLLSDRFSNALPAARLAARWTVENLQNPDGSFAHGIWADGIHRIPYLRWSQAWVFRALAELVLTERKARAETPSDQA